MEEETKIIDWEQDFLYTTEYCQQLREQSLSVLGCHIYVCIVLRGHWCNTIVLNVHSPSQEESDDAKQFL